MGRQFQIQKRNRSHMSLWTLSLDYPTVKGMMLSSLSSTTDALEVQYSYPARQLLLDPKSPNFILTICTDGMDYPNKSSVTGTPVSHLTLAAHLLRNLGYNKTSPWHFILRPMAYQKGRIRGQTIPSTSNGEPRRLERLACSCHLGS